MVTKVDRNNTNFSVQLFEIFKSIKFESKYDFLRYYQNFVRVFVGSLDVGSKGLLVYHTMGLGKSLLAVSIAIELHKKYQPILLLTKSLQQNMRSAIKKYVDLRCKDDPEFHLCKKTPVELEAWINATFSFVSMNASNMIMQMQKAAKGSATAEFDTILDKKLEVLTNSSLNGKLLIVDEAHNLFRAITNGSKNALRLYEQIMDTKNIRLIFLTGTPIANDPFELVSCFNMIGSRPGMPLFPENYREFKRLFVADDGSIINVHKFQNRIQGLVSHVSHLSVPGAALNIAATGANIEFPQQLEIIIEPVSMSADQYVQYQLARDKEKDEGVSVKFQRRSRPVEVVTAPMTKPKSMKSSTYRVDSRQLSNWAPPVAYVGEKDPTRIPAEYTGSPKFERILENIRKNTNKLGLVYSQFVGVGGLGIFSMFLKKNGWEEYGAALATKNPKRPGATRDQAPSEVEHRELSGARALESADISAETLDEPAFTGSALPSIEDYLHNIEVEAKRCTWWDRSKTARKHGAAERHKPTFALITGSVDTAERHAIQDVFNSRENMHGGIIDLLLISSTGAEGLDLKNVCHVHIMDPYWNESRIKQVIARGVRDNSHIDLPAAEKFVQPYIYLSVPPQSEKLPDGLFPPTTDVELYMDALKDEIPINNFLHILKEISIECLINDNPHSRIHCRKCNPTNQILFTDDIERDIRAIDPCTDYREEKITAQEIFIDDVSYYYVKDEKALYGYNIFVYDEMVSGYRQLSSSDPKFELIISAIENSLVD